MANVTEYLLKIRMDGQKLVIEEMEGIETKARGFGEKTKANAKAGVQLGDSMQRTGRLAQQILPTMDGMGSKIGGLLAGLSDMGRELWNNAKTAITGKDALGEAASKTEIATAKSKAWGAALNVGVFAVIAAAQMIFEKIIADMEEATKKAEEFQSKTGTEQTQAQLQLLIQLRTEQEAYSVASANRRDKEGKEIRDRIKALSAQAKTMGLGDVASESIGRLNQRIETLQKQMERFGRNAEIAYDKADRASLKAQEDYDNEVLGRKRVLKEAEGTLLQFELERMYAEEDANFQIAQMERIQAFKKGVSDQNQLQNEKDATKRTELAKRLAADNNKIENENAITVSGIRDKLLETNKNINSAAADFTREQALKIQQEITGIESDTAKITRQIRLDAVQGNAQAVLAVQRNFIEEDRDAALQALQDRLHDTKISQDKYDAMVIATRSKFAASERKLETDYNREVARNQLEIQKAQASFVFGQLQQLGNTVAANIKNTTEMGRAILDQFIQWAIASLVELIAMEILAGIFTGGALPALSAGAGLFKGIFGGGSSPPIGPLRASGVFAEGGAVPVIAHSGEVIGSPLQWGEAITKLIIPEVLRQNRGAGDMGRGGGDTYVFENRGLQVVGARETVRQFQDRFVREAARVNSARNYRGR